MKKTSFLLLAMAFGLFGMNAQTAQEQKAELAKRDAAPTLRAAAIYNELPSGYQSLGEGSKIYYSRATHSSVITGSHETFNILGEIDGKYYSSTYNDAGYLPAMQVNGGTAQYIDCVNGTTINGVNATAKIEPSGEVAAKISFVLTNNGDNAATVNVGMYGDVWIGDNDYAPIYRLNNADGETYGLRMKQNTEENSPLFCALFGEGITGVTPVDAYWFGHFGSNYSANAIVGNYSTSSSNWMVEGGNYDSAIGFCWKDRTIAPGETVEFSFLVSVGDIDFEDPIIPDDPEPGEDRFTYEVSVENIDAWNDLNVAHPANISGYYEHPYGQEGYIEYQVDGGEWIRIETPLTSGENYSLDFDMFFNTDIMTTHTLNLRFTLGLGTYTDLEGLSWTDVRSFDIDGFEDRYYNGEPQIYNVTINGESFTVGGDGMETYMYPGYYNYRYDGDYYENTIGVQIVEFQIFKGEPQITVVVPENVEYDGQAHGATVTVIAGDGAVTVTYVNLATGAESTEAPTEVGQYAVIVEMAETDYYEGIPATSYGQFEIYDKSTAVEEISIATEDNGAWYTIDGRRVAAPAERGLYIHNGKKVIVM